MNSTGPNERIRSVDFHLIIALCIALAVTDLLFIALHLVVWQPFAPDSLLHIGAEQSYSEIFQIVKYIMAMTFFGVAAYVHKQSFLAWWVLIVIILLIDDALGMHESWGGRIAEYLPDFLKGPLAYSWGEVTYFSIGAAFVMVILLLSHFLWCPPEMKTLHRFCILILCALAFVGIVIDFMHTHFSTSPRRELFFTVLEDGSEMLLLSLLTLQAARWVTFRQGTRAGTALSEASQN
ncbi:MAG: hypothetical protein Q4C87_07460 [Actinomycetaceae bacterium]|nr:hypothetical protein [Actinomycetaceae bacterium]